MCGQAASGIVYRASTQRHFTQYHPRSVYSLVRQGLSKKAAEWRVKLPQTEAVEE
jgi:hypothetical protein